MRLYIVASVLNAALLSACRPSDADTFTSMQLRDGSALASVVPQNGEAVALAIDPGDVMSCYGIVPAWLDLSRRSPVSVRVVLSREPKPNELKLLKLARIHVTGVLADNPSQSGVAVHQFRFRDGVLVEAETIPQGVMSSPMLDRLQPRPEGDRHLQYR